MIFKAYYDEWIKSVEGPEFHEMTRAVEFMGENGVPDTGIPCVFGYLGNVRTMEKLIVDIHRWPDTILDVCKTMQRVIDKRVESFLLSPSPVLYYRLGIGRRPQSKALRDARETRHVPRSPASKGA
jgi:hypothetical protein